MLITLAVAAFASIATQPPEDTIRLSEEGRSLELNPDNPEASIQFHYARNSVATSEMDDDTLVVRHTPVWDSSVVDPPALETELVGLDDQRLPPPEERGDPLRCGFDIECEGTYEAIFRWPEHLDTGSVRITWSIDSTITFPRRLPDDAEADITVLRTDADEASQEIASGQHRTDHTEAASAQTVTLGFDRALDVDTDLSVEIAYHVHSLTPADPVHIAIQDGPLVLAPPDTAHRLPITDECRAGPCTIAFTLYALHRDFRVTWTLAGTDATLDPTVETRDHQLVTHDATATVAVDDLAFDTVATDGAAPGDARELHIRAEIPAGLLPASAFPNRDTYPVVAVTLARPPGAPTWPDRARINVQRIAPEPDDLRLRSHGSWSGDRGLNHSLDGTHTEYREVPVACAVGVPCEIELVLGMHSSMLGPDPGPTDTRIVADVGVIVTYPIDPGPLPDDAIDISVTELP